MSYQKHQGSEGPSLPVLTAQELNSVPRPRPETWGPPPLHPYLFEERQNALRADIEELTRAHVPDDMPTTLADEIVGTAGTRFLGRMIANYDNFVSATRLDAPLTPMQRLLVNLSLGGNANPAELTYVSDLIGARGVALGTVTHPFGLHVEFLDEMRDAAEQTVRLFGGQVLDRTPVFSVKAVYREKDGSPRKHVGTVYGAKKDPISRIQRSYQRWAHPEREGTPLGVLVTRKKNIGQIAANVWFKERSSFIIRLDEAGGVDRVVKQALNTVIRSHHAMDNPIEGDSELHAAILEMLEKNEFDKAVPLATTLYKYDELLPGRVREAVDPDTTDPRKQSPALTHEVTRSQLVLSGVPLDFATAQRLPLTDLVPGRVDDKD